MSDEQAVPAAQDTLPLSNEQKQVGASGDVNRDFREWLSQRLPNLPSAIDLKAKTASFRLRHEACERNEKLNAVVQKYLAEKASELVSARRSDAINIGEALLLGQPMPPDSAASLAAEFIRVQQRCLPYLVENKIPHDRKLYNDALADLMFARSYFVDEIVRLRYARTAALMKSAVEFDDLTDVTMKSGVTQTLKRLAMSFHDVGEQARSGQQWPLGYIPLDGDFQALFSINSELGDTENGRTDN